MITVKDLLAIDPSLEDSQNKADKLSLFGHRLLKDGSARGVTALCTQEDIRNELILDSLVGLASLPKSGPIIDIGTGGGIPGLVLAIAKPELNFTLTDSTLKKTRWVAECVQELGLSNVVVKTARLELLGRQEDSREVYAAVTAKALANLSVLLELAMPLLRVGGRLVAYKGHSVAEEIVRAAKALRLMSAKIESSLPYQIAEKTYQLVLVTKLAPTAKRYPRRDGIPQKSPL